MMAAGNWADAKAAYQRALLERPQSGLVLFGLAMVHEQSGDIEAAAKEYKNFLSAWKDADSTLPQLGHARTYLAGHLAAN